MAYRLPAHLHRNRHGVLYFRLAVPNDIQHLLCQREIYRSLSTSNVRQAADVAQALRAAFGAIFIRLRCLIMSKQEKAAHEAWNAFTQLPDLRLRLNNAGMQVAIEEQQQALDQQEAMIVNLAIEQSNQNDRHERELNIAMRANNSTSLPAPRPDISTISEVWECYKAEKIALGCNGGWKDGEDSARYDHWPHIRTFIETISDKQIGHVTAEDAKRFQTYILTADPKESARNKGKRLMRVGALFRWAKAERIISDSLSEFFKYPGTVPKNNYQKFSLDDVKALFESDSYRNSRFKTPSEYWIPMLSLFTGGRLNEIAQLTVLDIGEHDGIQTLSILDEGGKRLKNTSSRRIIPIHSKLVELGFIEYVKARASKVHSGRLFPELSESKHKAGDYSKEPSRRFTDYRRREGVGGDKQNPATGKWEGDNRKAFHSFRSTLIDKLRKSGVPKERRTRLAGHEFVDTQDSNYDGGDALTMFPFPTLKADIDGVIFDVEFTLYDPKYYL